MKCIRCLDTKITCVFQNNENTLTLLNQKGEVK